MHFVTHPGRLVPGPVVTHHLNPGHEIWLQLDALDLASVIPPTSKDAHTEGTLALCYSVVLVATDASYDVPTCLIEFEQ